MTVLLFQLYPLVNCVYSDLSSCSLHGAHILTSTYSPHYHYQTCIHSPIVAPYSCHSQWPYVYALLLNTSSCWEAPELIAAKRFIPPNAETAAVLGNERQRFSASLLILVLMLPGLRAPGGGVHYARRPVCQLVYRTRLRARRHVSLYLYLAPSDQLLDLHHRSLLVRGRVRNVMFCHHY